MGAGAFWGVMEDILELNIDGCTTLEMYEIASNCAL